MSSPITPEVLLQHLDGTGNIRRWLRDVSWTLCQSGDKLVTSLIKSGFNGCPCERAELALGVLEEAGWIIRGKIDPVVGRSALAFSAAWPSVLAVEKRRVWCWMPGPALDLGAPADVLTASIRGLPGFSTDGRS